MLTLGNLLCGCLAIIKVFEGDLMWAAYLVGIALVLDFFDGFAARLLNVSSPIGKDLDSLADMVTFGVVPGMVMFQLIALGQKMMLDDGPAKEGWTIYPPSTDWISYIALVIPLFSCIRLARFNNDARQSDSFIGLPTPANAMVICALPLIFGIDAGFLSGPVIVKMDRLFLNPYVLCVVCCVFSLLLIAEIPLFALKFKGFSWKDNQNKLRFIFLGLAVIMLLLFHYAAIPLIIILYILLSIVNNIFLKTKV